MMRTLALALAIAVVAMASPGASAQSPAVKYNPAAEITAAGSVEQIIPWPDAEGNAGLHLVIQTASGLVVLRVAPALFVGMNNFSFNRGDQIEVVGTPVGRDNKTLIARVVRFAGKTLTLRDESGAPIWESGIQGTDGCGVVHEVAHAGSEG